MNEKIKIKSIKIKKETDKFTIWELETEDGRKLDCFDELKEGREYEGTITPNKNEKYNALFKLAKPEGAKKTFIPKNVTWEKRLGALTNAVNLCIAGKITLDQLAATKDKFYEYINDSN